MGGGGWGGRGAAGALQHEGELPRVLIRCPSLAYRQAFELRGAGAVLHGHSMNALLATLLDPEADEFRVTHVEMIKGIVGQASKAAGGWRGSAVRDGGGGGGGERGEGGRLAPQLTTTCLPAPPTAHCRVATPAAPPPTHALQGFFSVHSVPIIENTARECELTDRLRDAIRRYPQSNAVLVRRHGVYVWGRNWIEAKTQVRVGWKKGGELGGEGWGAGGWQELPGCCH